MVRTGGFLDDSMEVPDLASALRTVPETVAICGHTHILWSERVDGRLAPNPGAVSGFLNEDPRAHYAVLTWTDRAWRVGHRAVPNDMGRLRTACRETGYLDEGGGMARLFLLTLETGWNLMSAYFAHVDRVAREAGHETWSVAPDPVWHRAAVTFSWPDGHA
jgi:hypothetical protein